VSGRMSLNLNFLLGFLSRSNNFRYSGSGGGGLGRDSLLLLPRSVRVVNGHPHLDLRSRLVDVLDSVSGTTDKLVRSRSDPGRRHLNAAGGGGLGHVRSNVRLALG